MIALGLLQNFCRQAACHFSVVTILYLEQLLHGNPIHRLHSLHLSFENEHVGKEMKYICFEFLNGERVWGEQQTRGQKQRIFFFFFSICLLLGWIQIKKGVIKNHLVCWILSSISEHPDEIWVGSINLYLSCY